LVDILLTDTSTKETVSVLEIDINDEQSTEYGVNPGQLVFLCENNGSPIPHVPAIGRVPESMTDAVLRLKVLSDIPPPPFETADPRLPPNNVDWFGEVISLELDGRIRVLQSNGVTITVGLQNVLRLRLLNEDEMMDLMDQQDDNDATMTETPPRVNPIDAFFSAMQARFPGVHFADVDPPGQTNGDVEDTSSEDSWETTSSIEDEDMEAEESNSISFANTASGEPDGPVTATDMRDDPMNTETASDDMDRVDESIEVVPSSPPTHMSRSPPPTTFDESSSQAGPSSEPRDVQWESFDILETAPADHRYYAEAPAASSRVRMKKVNAEHKALRSSLPGGSIGKSELMCRQYLSTDI
jgi:ubiquitin-conjugating enzyme E2 O